MFEFHLFVDQVEVLEASTFEFPASQVETNFVSTFLNCKHFIDILLMKINTDSRAIINNSIT